MSQNTRIYRHSFVRMVAPVALLILLAMGLFYGFFVGFAPNILLGLFLLIDAFLLGAMGYGFLLFTNRLEVNEETIKHIFFQGKEEIALQEVVTYARKKRYIYFYNQAGEEVLRVFSSLLNEQTFEQIPQFAQLKKA